ncbi:MAG: hypothetical protein KC503_09070 [Myxococcales bacterium]|nr:hypothetical protein [Myxococcales bacterium]
MKRARVTAACCLLAALGLSASACRHEASVGPGGDASNDSRDGGDGDSTRDQGPPPMLETVTSGEHKLADGNPKTISIEGWTPADLVHSFVLCSYRTADEQPSGVPACRLTKAGLVIGTGPGTGDLSTVVRWTVVRDVSFDVRRGEVTLANGIGESEAIKGKFAADRSFILVDATTKETSQIADEGRLIRPVVTGADFVLTRLSAQNDATAYWQVVQLANDGRVVAGTTSIATDSNTAVDTFPQVTLERSFVLFSVTGPTNIGGFEQRYSVQATLSAGSVEFKRGVAEGPLDITYFVVELAAGNQVKHLPPELSLGQSREIFVSPAVDPDLSFVVHSLQSNTLGRTAARVDTAYTAALSKAGDRVELKRIGGGNAVSTVSTSVIRLASP